MTRKKAGKEEKAAMEKIPPGEKEKKRMGEKIGEKKRKKTRCGVGRGDLEKGKRCTLVQFEPWVHVYIIFMFSERCPGVMGNFE